MAFDADTLARPVLHANPGLFPLFEQHAAGPTTLTLVEQVRCEIVRQRKGEVPTLAAVADGLHLGVRTLQLKAAHHTYQQLLDAVRCELAERYLREPHLSTTESPFYWATPSPASLCAHLRNGRGRRRGRFAASHPVAVHPVGQQHGQPKELPRPPQRPHRGGWRAKETP